MDVHIVYASHGHIVPRMMQALADTNGWTHGPNYRADADFNYYGSYVVYSITGTTKTPTGGWFTHFEPGRKAMFWKQAATKMQLRCTASQLYIPQLESYGLTRRVTPYIDLDHFQVDDHIRQPVIGIVAVNNPVRKGTELVERLYLDQDYYEADLVIYGRDWGTLPHTWCSYSEMPIAYGKMEVYLCTAIAEGIPAPPLEALACGTKVVIPSQVGVMDELPEQPGIRHYKVGDYADMERALVLALDDEAHPLDLRQTVLKYNQDAWAQTTKEAIQDALSIG